MEAQKKLTELIKAIYFAFDDYTLNEDATSKLQQASEILKKNPGLQINIEGHTDSRGSIEYNLALGEKRARAVVQFLEDTGVPSKQFSFVSYGKEKPAVIGEGEDIWAKNRRAEIIPQSKEVQTVK